MSMQEQERLTLDGREYPLLDRPLERCEDAVVFTRVQSVIHDPRMHDSSLHRNYLGSWSIRQNCLFLEDVEILCEEHLGSNTKELPRRGLAWLFPDSQGPVIASWFTGSLRLGDGLIAKTRYQQEWAEHIVLTVEAGKVRCIERQSNEQAFSDCQRQGDKLGRYLDSL